MVIYHGSSEIVENPQIIQSEIGRDFGFAFYTTDIREQAIRWAKRKALLAKRKKPSAQAIINEYIFDETSAEKAIKVYRFDGATVEWLEMILRCRSNIAYHHGYDIIIGKIANDNVGETIAYVLRGIMRKEDAMERLRFQKINNQIAFCSERALAFLSYHNYFIVDGIAND